MFLDIKYEDIDKLSNYIFIDVRSPDEYKEATIPNSINIPLFNNEERALVGTVYKEKGQVEATQLGVQIVSPKIPGFMENITELSTNKTPIFFCWRGGMRSKTMATLYDLMYPDSSYRLTGGYRAYREFILENINNTQITIPTFVLHGMTGVGKTMILNELEQLGLFVIDLEGLAGHRGSIFGGIGNVPVNQKAFDSELYEAFKNLNTSNSLIIEAESQRIGKIIVPDNILDAKSKGHHILVFASKETRIKRIIEEYQPVNFKNEIHDAIKKLERRIPTEHRKDLITAYENNNFEKVVAILLDHYYDPRYQFSTDQYHQGPFFEVNSDDIHAAAKAIHGYVLNTVNNKVTV